MLKKCLRNRGLIFASRFLQGFFVFYLLNGIEKVRGSTPLISTPSLPLPRQTTEATKVSPSHNTPCLTLEVNFLLTLRGYYGRRGNVRKKTELVSPRTCPTEECGRFSKFSPTPFQVTFKCAFSHTGENFESTALGVECVLRKSLRREASRRNAVP